MLTLRSLLLFSVLFVPAVRSVAAESFLRIVAPGKTLTFTAGEFAALPRTEAKFVDPHDQKERTYSGVAVRELLARAGAPLGEKLRGPAQLTGVIVRCRDNFAVLFALAEFDEAFSARTIILADREDGELLPPNAAPLRIVAPGDKRGSRLARQVTVIEIISLAPP